MTLYTFLQRSPPGRSLHARRINDIIIIVRWHAIRRRLRGIHLNWLMFSVLCYIIRDLFLWTSATTVKSQERPRRYCSAPHMRWRQWQIYDAHIRHRRHAIRHSDTSCCCYWRHDRQINVVIIEVARALTLVAGEIYVKWSYTADGRAVMEGGEATNSLR